MTPTPQNHVSLKLEEESKRFKKGFQLLERNLNREIKKSLKRIEERKQILFNCLDWEKVQHEGKLLQANFYRIEKGAKSLSVEDWENEGKERILSLDPLTSPHLQVEKFYKRSKKLHKGIPHAKRMITLAETAFADLERKLLDLQQIKVIPEETQLKALEQFIQVNDLGYQSLPNKLPSKKVTPAKPYHRYKTESGVEILVGKSAKGNDLLTFHVANGNNWWLHAHNHPGSHVVIRLDKGRELDQETISDAAELALRYSKAKQKLEGEVCLTQVKYLKPVKGVPGKVMLSQHKVLRVVPNEERWLRLKSSC